MMQVGIKIGPENWKDRLEESGAKLCEVWFRVDWEEKYSEMFEYLREHEIKTGLHFWGVCKNNIYPCLLTDDKEIRQESVNLIKKTIEIAAKNGFYYVNAHPEARQLFRLTFPLGEVELLNKITSDEDGKKYLLESSHELTEFGKKNGVLFLLETVPRLVIEKWWGKQKREPTLDTKLVPSSWLEKMGEAGVSITTDVDHVLTEVTSQDPDVLVKELIEKIKRLAPFTKLLHVATTPPPFNGTDGHGGFSKEDYQKGAIPKAEDFKEIIRIVLNRNPDLLIIPEPEKDHVKNYNLVKDMIKEIESPKEKV